MTATAIQSNLTTSYPETKAGGFSRCDGTIQFYQRINALLTPNMHVLDYGAGRGEQLLDETVPYRSQLAKLHGRVEKLVGVDLDDAVLQNPFMDETHVIEIGKPLPFEPESFDLIYADWVIEHVTSPTEFVQEVHRLLKPGGWFCARTPNRWGVTGLAANFIPNALHTRLLARLQPDRDEADVFPTAYAMNTLGAIRSSFPRSRWKDCSYVHNAEPPYVQRSRLLMNLMRFYWRITPSGLHTVLNVFVQRLPDN